MDPVTLSILVDAGVQIMQAIQLHQKGEEVTPEMMKSIFDKVHSATAAWQAGVSDASGV